MLVWGGDVACMSLILARASTLPLAMVLRRVQALGAGGSGGRQGRGRNIRAELSAKRGSPWGG